MELKVLATEIEQMKNEARSLYAEIESDESKGFPHAEKSEKLNKLVADGIAKQELYNEQKKASDFVMQPATPATGAATSNTADGVTHYNENGPNQEKSWGRQVIESKQFATNNGREMQPIELKLLREGTGATGGSAVYSERIAAIVDNALTRPVQLLDILNTSATNSSNIDYIAVTGFTNSAGETAEWDGSSNYQIKPESDLTFALRNVPVQVIAHWIRASRMVLADAPQLENMVNVKLLKGLAVRLESQVLNGNGTTPNLLGIYATSGIQLRVMHATTPVGRGQLVTDTKADTIRRALTDIRLAFYQPDSIVLNPADAEAIELTKTTQNAYVVTYDPVAMRIWRTPVIETAATAAGTGLVGALRTGATLYVRDQAEVRISENVADDFIRNAVRVLCEMRAALAVTDAPAFEKLTLI